MGGFELKVIVIIAYCFTELSSIKQTTLSVKQKVAVLRQQIQAEINEKIQPIDENTSFEFNEYDHDRYLMTPLVKKKRKDRTTEQIRQTSTVRNAAILPTLEPAEEKTPNSQLRSIKHKLVNHIAKNISDRMNVFSLRKPVDIFYRRLLDESEMNREVPWAHCQDMITPYLRGIKKELGHQPHLSTDSPIVKRFIHLLTLNTTMYTKEDIFSVLFQISNLQLRLFQWDVQAINLLFNVLMKGKPHTFRNLKWGIRTLFAEWRLDISNITNLLHEARLFRPPCIMISESTGSTKAKTFSTYPKKMKLPKQCDSKEDDGCRNKG